MTVPVLRSVGNQMHPVGPLTVSNYFLNPGLIDSTSGALNDWITTTATFAPDAMLPAISGTKVGKFTATSIGPVVAATQQVNVTQSNNYIMSAYLNIATALSVPLYFAANTFDANNSFLGTLGGIATNGATTVGWERVSQLMLMPVNTTYAYFYLYLGITTALDSFYVNGLLLEQASTVGPYNDGSMSGYVWSGAPNESTTIKTEFPDALAAFGTYPLIGGMGAGASMYRPQFATLVD